MIPRRYPHRIAAALAALAMLTAAPSAASSDFTWIGGAGDWANPLNWIGGVLPSAGDSVFIDGGNAMASFVTIGGAIEIANLSVDSGDTLKLTSGSSLRVTSNVSAVGTVINDNGTVHLPGGNTGSGIVNPGGSLTLTGGGTTQNPVTVVSEPDAYALMLGGLALIGCLAVRRRRNQRD